MTSKKPDGLRESAPALGSQRHTTLTGLVHRGPVEHCGVCNFEGPRAFCTCGHFGDVRVGDAHPEPNMHGGPLGHGACINCACTKFSWKKWSSRFKDALDKALVKGGR